MERKSKKIKILFTIPNFNTAGSGKALLNIAVRLDNNIFEPHIACLHNNGSFFKIVEQSGIPIHIFQFTCSMIPRIRGLLNCWKISKWIKESKFDLIHSFHYAPDYSEVLASKLARTPWIFTKKNMNWGGKSKNAWLLRSIMAKHIILQNTAMKQEFYSTYKKVSLIHRGVNISEFSNVKNKKIIYKKNRIPIGSKIIIVVANLVPVKGIENLIYAFDKLPSNMNLYLLIVGSDSNTYSDKLKNIAFKTNKCDKIKFLGKRSDINMLLKISNIFVLPTLNQGRREGSPVALLEAMASGIPVLASKISGSSDILNTLPNHLFNPSDKDILSKKIQWILSMSDKEKNEIIRKQLNIIKKNHNINLEVLKHQIVYQQCLNH